MAVNRDTAIFCGIRKMDIMEHSDIILQIMSERDITSYRMAKETGISESLFGAWRKKPTSKIYSGNLVLIADYLGCSVDYLLGRAEGPEGRQRAGGDPE